jgi:hypothetical protein
VGIITSGSSNAQSQLQDFGRGNGWPSGAEEKLNTFRQGHIIEKVPVVYIGSRNCPHWHSGTSLAADGLGDDLAVCMEDGTPLRYGMILTQGCDIQRSHAWVNVSPVYDARERLDQGSIGNVARGRIQYLLPITPPWALEGSCMVADLRFTAPVEKTLLLEREPLEAYSDASDYQNVGERLALLSGGRSDVTEEVLNGVVTPFFTWADENKFSEYTEIRVTQDSFSKATVAGLFVITKDISQINFEIFDEAFPAVYEAASSHGVTLEFLKAVTLDSMTGAEYRDSQPVTAKPDSSS